MRKPEVHELRVCRRCKRQYPPQSRNQKDCPDCSQRVRLNGRSTTATGLYAHGREVTE